MRGRKEGNLPNEMPLEDWPDSDAAMARLASSRDDILAQSNRFLIAGMVCAVLYGVKAVGLRLDLVLLDTKIFEVPYGLFIFCIVGSGSFLIAQSRFLDAHSLDVRLKELATKFRPSAATDYYRTFPSKNSWLEMTREQFFSKQGPNWFATTMMMFVGLTLLVIYSLPLIACAHFLWNWPEVAGDTATSLQWWVVLVCTTLDVLFFLFVQRVYALSA